MASDHSTYIGVISNLTFGVLTGILTLGGAALLASQIVFWGMNLGLAVFVVGLVSGTQVLKQVGAPTMGVCLLLGLAIFALALVGARSSEATEPAGAIA